jgi:hypothetical protein
MNLITVPDHREDGTLVECYSGRSLSQYNFVNNKSLIDRSGIKIGPPRWETGD